MCRRDLAVAFRLRPRLVLAGTRRENGASGGGRRAWAGVRWRWQVWGGVGAGTCAVSWGLWARLSDHRAYVETRGGKQRGRRRRAGGRRKAGDVVTEGQEHAGMEQPHSEPANPVCVLAARVGAVIVRGICTLLAATGLAGGAPTIGYRCVKRCRPTRGAPDIGHHRNRCERFLRAQRDRRPLTAGLWRFVSPLPLPATVGSARFLGTGSTGVICVAPLTRPLKQEQIRER